MKRIRFRYLLFQSLAGLCFLPVMLGQTATSPAHVPEGEPLSPQAEFAAGLKYEKGPKPDIILALIWLRKAADHNLAAAQEHLAALFESGGNGVEKNMNESARWYEVLAKNDQSAQEKREAATRHLKEIDGGTEVSSNTPASAQTLAVAIESQILDDVEDQLRKGAPVNSAWSDREGTIPLSPLQRAAFHGSLSIVRLLMDHGADVNFDDEHGQTVLHWATDPEIVKILIKKGADPNAKTEEGLTPLHTATLGDRNETILQALLSSGADVNARNNKGDTPIAFILKRQFQVGEVQYEPACAIGPAALGRLSILVSAKPNLNLQDSDGNTALSLGQKIQTSCKHSDSSDSAAMGRILGLGPPGPQTATTLVCAIESNDLKRVQTEVQDGAPVNGVGFGCQDFVNGWTPLSMAAHVGNIALVKLLLDHGADAKALAPSDISSRSAALNFVQKDPEIAKLLIAKGANPNGNESGQPPLAAIAIDGSQDIESRVKIAKLLLASGARIDVTDSIGDTPLMSLLQVNSGCHDLPSILPLVSVLVEAKSNPQIANQNGDTAISLAEQLASNCEDAPGKASAAKILRILNTGTSRK